VSGQSQQNGDSPQGGTAHPALTESFRQIEGLARDVLREQGLSEDEIYFELTRAQRPHGMNKPKA
jgi:hypothetical protein